MTVELFELIKRYGRYLGGIDYEKVIKMLSNEHVRDHTIEQHLLRDELGLDEETIKLLEKLDHNGREDILTSLERRRLEAKLEYLKQRERQLADLVAELKLRQYPLAEVKKAVRKLSEVRREIRNVRRLLRLLESE